jgi:RimJ/RimL family protein N-acetyltransferase
MQGFETERLRMRPLDARDEALYCALYTDPDTMRFIAAPQSLQRALRSFHKMIEQPRPVEGPYLFAILEKISGRALGLSAIVQIDRQLALAEVGIMLNTDVRGLGFAHETMFGLRAHAFSALPIDAIWVQYHRANLAAGKLFRELGFFLAADLKAAGEKRAQHCIAVCRQRANHNQGEENVESHQLSGKRGQGRKFATRQQGRTRSCNE